MSRPNNAEIQEIAKLNPCVTHKDIGRMVGLSGERIRQICGNRGKRKDELHKLETLEYIICAKCGKARYYPKGVLKYKREHGQKIFFCSLKCHHQSVQGWLPKPTMERSGTFERNSTIYYLKTNYHIPYKGIARYYRLSEGRVNDIVTRFRVGHYK